MHRTKLVQPQWKAFKLQLWEARVVVASSNIVYCATHTSLYMLAMEEVGCKEEQCPVTLLEARVKMVKCYKDDEFPATRQHFCRQYIIIVTSIEHVGVIILITHPGKP